MLYPLSYEGEGCKKVVENSFRQIRHSIVTEFTARRGGRLPRE